MSGYLYAYSTTEGNIFLNFPASDKIMFLGRLGYGVTIVFAMPLVLLPNREALLALPGQWETFKKERQESNTSVMIDEETPLRKLHESNGSLAYSSDGTSLVKQNDTESSSTIDTIFHFASSIIILVVCYFGAVAVPGVAVVWSIVGSSMAIIIAFTLPALCYIKIRAHTGWTRRMINTWVLLLFSIVAGIVCTTQTIQNL